MNIEEKRIESVTEGRKGLRIYKQGHRWIEVKFGDKEIASKNVTKIFSTKTYREKVIARFRVGKEPPEIEAERLVVVALIDASDKVEVLQATKTQQLN